MGLLFIFLILLSGSVFFSIKFKNKIDNNFIIWIMSIILILYLFGLLGILKFGYYLVILISTFLFLYDIYYIFKNRSDKNLRGLLLTKGLTTFILMFLAFILIHHGRVIYSFDEFSHWGDVVKAMYTTDAFSTSPLSMSAFQSYPPAMSLFQYLWVKVAGNFDESLLYISYNLVGMCLFLPFTSKIDSKKQYFLGTILLIICPFMLFNNYYSAIYIDPMVGLFFGFIILKIIEEKEYSNFFMLNILLSLFVLVLLKDVGVFFALISVVVLVLDLFKKKKINLKNIKDKKKYLIIILACIVCILLAKESWNLCIKFSDAKVSFKDKIDLLVLFKILTGSIVDYRREVISNFFIALYEKPIISSIINLDFIRLSVLLLVLFRFLLSKKDIDNKILTTLYGGLIFYTFGLCILYLFRFIPYEAINLASYTRYLSIYFSGMLFIITGLVIKDLKKSSILLIIFMMFMSYYNVIRTFTIVSDAKTNRDKYLNAVHYIDKHVTKDEKIYVVVQNSDGFEYWNLRFLLRPRQINDFYFTWSIGSKYNDQDIWTLDINSDDWIETLHKDNFDYVYIYKCDEKFSSEFGSLFESSDDIRNNTLFEVKSDKLVLVE